MPDQAKPEVKANPKPKYETPQIVRLNEIATGQGGFAPGSCGSGGSALAGDCHNGTAVGGICTTGTGL